MELTVKDRLILLQLLPEKVGDLTILRLVHELRLALSFSEEEHKVLQFAYNAENTRMAWDFEQDIRKDVDIGPRMHVVLLDKLKELAEQGELREELLPIIDKLGYTGDE